MGSSNPPQQAAPVPPALPLSPPHHTAASAFATVAQPAASRNRQYLRHCLAAHALTPRCRSHHALLARASARRKHLRRSLHALLERARHRRRRHAQLLPALRPLFRPRHHLVSSRSIEYEPVLRLRGRITPLGSNSRVTRCRLAPEQQRRLRRPLALPLYRRRLHARPRQLLLQPRSLERRLLLSLNSTLNPASPPQQWRPVPPALLRRPPRSIRRPVPSHRNKYQQLQASCSHARAHTTCAAHRAAHTCTFYDFVLKLRTPKLCARNACSTLGHSTATRLALCARAS